MTKKYKLLLDDIKDIGNTKLYRIQRLSDGQLGGYIQSEDNLSHLGNTWVSDNAQVSGNARVYGDAQVCGYAWVYGDAKVYGNAQVFGDARVYGDAQVYGNVWVYGNTRVYGNAQVSGNARVYGDAQVWGGANVYGDARVYDYAWVYDNARVSGKARVISPQCIIHLQIGSNFHVTILRRQVQIGCKVFTRDQIKAITASRAEEYGLRRSDYIPYRKMILGAMRLISPNGGAYAKKEIIK